MLLYMGLRAKGNNNMKMQCPICGTVSEKKLKVLRDKAGEPIKLKCACGYVWMKDYLQYNKD